jgi:hypothetical protein
MANEILVPLTPRLAEFVELTLAEMADAHEVPAVIRQCKLVIDRVRKAKASAQEERSGRATKQ